MCDRSEIATIPSSDMIRAAHSTECIQNAAFSMLKGWGKTPVLEICLNNKDASNANVKVEKLIDHRRLLTLRDEERERNREIVCNQLYVFNSTLYDS